MIKLIERSDTKIVITLETSTEAELLAPAVLAFLEKGETMTRDIAVGRAKAGDVRFVDSETGKPLKEKSSSVVEPMIGRILIKPHDFRYGGRIVIPEKNQRRPTVGTIVNLNLPSDSNPNKFEVGQVVVYGVYSGTPILLTIDGTETPLIALTPDEVIVRLRGDVQLKESGQGY